MQPQEPMQNSRSWKMESPNPPSGIFPSQWSPKQLPAPRCWERGCSHYPELWDLVVTVRFHPEFSHSGATQLPRNFVTGGSGKQGWSWDFSWKAQSDPALHLNSDFLGSAFATSFPPCHCRDNFGKAPAQLNFSIWTLGIIAKPLSLTRCFQIPREKAPRNCRTPGFWGVWRFIGCQISTLPRKMKCWGTRGVSSFSSFLMLGFPQCLQTSNCPWNFLGLLWIPSNHSLWKWC